MLCLTSDASAAGNQRSLHYTNNFNNFLVERKSNTNFESFSLKILYRYITRRERFQYIRLHTIFHLLTLWEVVMHTLLCVATYMVFRALLGKYSPHNGLSPGKNSASYTKPSLWLFLRTLNIRYPCYTSVPIVKGW